MSPFEASLSNNGAPLANARVKLWYTWATAEGEDAAGHTVYFTTNEEGYVSMPSIEKKIFISNVQPNASMYTIEVEVDDEFETIADITKRSPDLYSELGSKVPDMKCDLESPMTSIKEKNINSRFISVCEWTGSDSLSKKALD